MHECVYIVQTPVRDTIGVARIFDWGGSCELSPLICLPWTLFTVLGTLWQSVLIAYVTVLCDCEDTGLLKQAMLLQARVEAGILHRIIIFFDHA